MAFGMSYIDACRRSMLKCKVVNIFNICWQHQIYWHKIDTGAEVGAEEDVDSHHETTATYRNKWVCDTIGQETLATLTRKRICHRKIAVVWDVADCHGFRRSSCRNYRDRRWLQQIDPQNWYLSSQKMILDIVTAARAQNFTALEGLVWQLIVRILSILDVTRRVIQRDTRPTHMT